ncbi:HTH-type transcriptional repressor NsrR [Mycobacterium antarcticum]|uniref:RrF2 family transcriptional regulator n=1 Tax=unclassified Mycolicibacterium TaxID=2636767 RepID=UPI002396C1FF|nr:MULTISPECIES: Rrf2 family transcriptional regulator [unclassified Mycolicibacterium]BDX33506.1 HTH-type transcriptional repressor NsrR [Mycolicibacterium sp. TUM20985]GLP82883.1 HTH-type transcriptional repressor NsrR [Mycolicibacterium sp. TUM20984]
MHITRFADLGLRAVMRLAATTDERPSSKEIAAQLSVSYLHMTKVITRLAELGVVDARRGRGGGLTITELGRTARVGWLVRRLEKDNGREEVIECEGTNPCPLRFGCRLRGALRVAQDAFYASLDELTIDDLIQTPTKNVLLALPGLHGSDPRSTAQMGN